MTCSNCGTANPDGAEYCARCGARLMVVAAGEGTTHQAASGDDGGPVDAWTAASAGRQRVGPRVRLQVDPERFLVRDWLGALIACLAALVVMLVVMTLVEVISPHHPPAGVMVANIFADVGLAVGGSIIEPQTGSPTASSVSFLPMTASLLGFGLLGLLTARRLRRRAGSAGVTSGDFLWQGLRTLLVMVVLLVILGLVVRHGHRAHGFSGLSDAQAAASGYVRIATAFTAFFGAVLTFVTLVLTWLAGLPEALPTALRPWRDRLVGASVGVLWLCVVAFVLTSVYTLVQILAVPHGLSDLTNASLLTDSTASRREEFSAFLALAPNVTASMLLFAMGVPRTESVGGLQHATTLTTFTDANGVYWLVPIVAALLWLLAAGVATLYGASPRAGRRHALLLPVPVLALVVGSYVLDGFHAHTVGFGSSVHLHFDFWWGVLAALLWSAVAAVVMTNLVLRLPPALLRSVRRILIRRFHAPPADAAGIPDPADLGQAPAPETAPEPPERQRSTL